MVAFFSSFLQSFLASLWILWSFLGSDFPVILHLSVLSNIVLSKGFEPTLISFNDSDFLVFCFFKEVLIYSSLGFFSLPKVLLWASAAVLLYTISRKLSISQCYMQRVFKCLNKTIYNRWAVSGNHVLRKDLTQDLKAPATVCQRLLRNNLSRKARSHS